MSMMNEPKSLAAAISAQVTLNESQQRALLQLFGKGCQSKTKERLSRRFALPLALWPNYGIFGRVHLSETGASYCAGQDYPSEISYIRSLIIKG